MQTYISAYTPLTAPPIGYNWMPPPPPRRVSQKERRKKARYRRSQEIKVR